MQPPEPRQQRDAGAPATTPAGIIVVGRCGGPFGVKGWLRVASFTDPPENLLGYRPWSLRRNGAWRPVAVEASRAQGSGLIAKFEAIDDRESAATLAGTDVGIPESTLPPPGTDEYYWKDLIGMTVISPDGRHLGRVQRLLETGAHDVLVVGDGAAPLLIPFVSAIIGEVDVKARRLIADWNPDLGVNG